MVRAKASIFIPKGGMCRVCKWCLNDCSMLDFEAMPVIENIPSSSLTGDPALYVVRCSRFERPTKKPA